MVSSSKSSSSLLRSLRSCQANALKGNIYAVRSFLNGRVPKRGEIVMMPFGVEGPIALAAPYHPSCLAVFPDKNQIPFFIGREIPKNEIDIFKQKKNDGSITNLEQQIFEWPDPFGTSSTFINKIRTERPTVSRQAPLAPTEDAKLVIEERLAPNQGDNWTWYRMALAFHSTDPIVLSWLAQKDKDPNVRRVASENPHAPLNIYWDSCDFCSRSKWGPGSFPRNAYESQTVGIKPNIYGFMPVRHYNLITEDWVHEITEDGFNRQIFDDIMKITFLKLKELHGGNDHRYISNENADDVYTEQKFNTDLVDGMIWGINFGVERVVGSGLKGVRPHPSFASFQHFHAQWGVLPRGSYYEGDAISEICQTWKGIRTDWATKGIDFFGKYIEALQGTDPSLVIWKDKCDKPEALLVAPPSQRVVDELQLICPSVSNILDTDEAIRKAISQGMYYAFKILNAMGVNTLNVVAYGERFSRQSTGMRLFFRIMPRGGIAFSELQGRWVVNKFPGKTAEEAREKLKELQAQESKSNI